MTEIEKMCGMTQEEIIYKIHSNKVNIDENIKRLKERREELKQLRIKSEKLYNDFTDSLEKHNKMVEETVEDVCDNFCKYRESCDENNECDWIRQGNTCPLDRLI